MGGAIALELARRRAISSATAFSPAGFWNTPELRYAQASLGALGGRAGGCATRTSKLSPGARAGRIALFSQLFGYPARLPAEEAVATLRDAWASPALAGALAAFDEYRFAAPEALRSTPVTIAWGVRDRLLPYRLQAPRARAMLPWATHADARGGPRALLRRPGRGRRRDPLDGHRAARRGSGRLSARSGAHGRDGHSRHLAAPPQQRPARLGPDRVVRGADQHIAHVGRRRR